MNKNTKLIIFFLIIIVAAVFVYITDRKSVVAPGNEQKVEPNMSAFDLSTITTETGTDTSNEGLEIKFEYPKGIIGADYVRGVIDTKLAQFKTDNDPAKFSTQELADYGPNKDRPYSFITIYKAYASKSVLTHRVDTYMYTGGAHGNTFIETFMYTSDGVLTKPQDLFVDQTGVQKFSELVINEALALTDYKEVINTEWLADSAGPDVSNFKTLAFDGTDIVVIFQQYDIAPYAAGIIEVRVPLNKLTGVLKPEFLK